MKKSILIILINALLLSFFANAQSLPYTADYSSHFKIGTHDLSKMILTLYKDYEKSDFSTNEPWFSDTVMAILPDGHVIRGKADVITTFKNERQNNGDVTFTMDAIIPLVSVDRKENWVALWGSSQSAQGKQDFQAIWRVNKDKKVDFIKIYSAQASR